MPVRKWSWEPSYLTDIITCQIRKQNPGQTLSDFGVNFHVVHPLQRVSWIRGRRAAILSPSQLPVHLLEPNDSRGLYVPDSGPAHGARTGDWRLGTTIGGDGSFLKG